METEEKMTEELDSIQDDFESKLAALEDEILEDASKSEGKVQAPQIRVRSNEDLGVSSSNTTTALTPGPTIIKQPFLLQKGASLLKPGSQTILLNSQQVTKIIQLKAKYSGSFNSSGAKFIKLSEIGKAGLKSGSKLIRIDPKLISAVQPQSKVQSSPISIKSPVSATSARFIRLLKPSTTALTLKTTSTAPSTTIHTRPLTTSSTIQVVTTSPATNKIAPVAPTQSTGSTNPPFQLAKKKDATAVNKEVTATTQQFRLSKPQLSISPKVFHVLGKEVEEDSKENSAPTSHKSNVPSNRKEMLANLFKRKKKIEESLRISDDDLKGSTEREIYVRFLKRIYPKVVLLPPIINLIRKYEGGSIPIPVLRKCPLSDTNEDRLEVRELNSELQIYDMAGNARFLFLSDADHDRLAVILFAITSRVGQFYFCNPCHSKFSKFGCYIDHLINEHPVLLRCIYCGDVFVGVMDFKQHGVNSQHGYCKDCSTSYPDYEDFIIHRRSVHSKKDMSVILRPSKNTPERLKAKLLIHLKKFHSDNNCHVCSSASFKLTMESCSRLYDHHISNHVAFFCSFCSKSGNDEIFCSDLEFFGHCTMMDHNFCPICNNLFRSTFNLRCHLMEVHGVDPDHPSIKIGISTYPKIINNFRCSACSFTSVDEQSVIKHIKAMGEDSIIVTNDCETLKALHKKLMCKKCDVVFLTREELISHCGKRHIISNGDLLKSFKKPIKTPMPTLDYTMEVRIDMETVLRNAVLRIDPETKKAIYSFTKSSFIKKVLNPLKDRKLNFNVKCESCKIWFPSSIKLNVHITDRHQEFVCSHCLFIAIGKISLDRHLELHKNEIGKTLKDVPLRADKVASFRCGTCQDKVFSCYKEFSSHVLSFAPSHKNLICPVCNIACVSAKTRQKHVRNAHLDQLCHVCDSAGIVSTFETKAAFDNHISNDHSDLLCGQCPVKKYFLSKTLLAAHIESEHSEEFLDERTQMPEKVFRCLDNSCADINCNAGVFISEINHNVHRHHETLDHDDSQNEQPFKPSHCSLCPDGLKYFTFAKLATHVREHHSDFVVCFECLDMPIFEYKKDLFVHGKTFDHWGCYRCSIGSVGFKLTWYNIQRHLKDTHGSIFCWKCQCISKALKKHRILCSTCDDVYCDSEASGKSDHRCSEQKIMRKKANQENKDFMKVRQININKYTTIKTSEVHIFTGTLVDFYQSVTKVLHKHTFASLYDIEESTWPLDKALNFLCEATNVPNPDKYLVRLWIDLWSLKSLQDATTLVDQTLSNIKIEPLFNEEKEKTLENDTLMQLQKIEEDIIIKDELIVSDEEDENFDVSDSSLLQDIEDILESDPIAMQPSISDKPQNNEEFVPVISSVRSTKELKRKADGSIDRRVLRKRKKN